MSMSSRSSDHSTSSALVVFAYAGSDEGELSLLKGSLVDVIEMCSGDWWYGRNDTGDEGYFPKSFVKMSFVKMTEEEEDVPPHHRRRTPPRDSRQ